MPQKKTLSRTCLRCGSKFKVRPVDARRGFGKYCSKSCSSAATIHEKLPVKSGPSNPAWKGGTQSSKGYWYIMQHGHHRAMKSGYVKRADLVMENHLGRLLKKDEVVHHLDKNRENDSAENLRVMSKEAHRRLHAEGVRKLRSRKPDHPSNKRYEWPGDEELLKMRQSMSLRKMAQIVGCSHKVVDRRLRKLGMVAVA